MVFFKKQIVDKSVINPIVITLSNFSAGGITDFVFLYLDSITVNVVDSSFIPASIVAEITSNGNVAIDNSATTAAVKLVFDKKNNLFSSYKGTRKDPVKFAAATTTITITFKDDQGTSLVYGDSFYNIEVEMKIIGK
jgi:hypothetical protein